MTNERAMQQVNDRMDALQRELRQLRVEVSRSGGFPPSVGSTDTDTGNETGDAAVASGPATSVSRRRLLTVGASVAAGVGLAIVEGTRTAPPAAAADRALLLETINDAGSFTGLTANVALGSSFFVENFASGTGPHQAIRGQSGSGAGLFGQSDSGDGVQALSSTGTAVHGMCPSGSGHAIFGDATTSGHAVLGINAGSGNGVFGVSSGTGGGGQGAVVGLHSGAGRAVYGVITNSSSTFAAVEGNTNGSGAAVRATATGQGPGVVSVVTSPTMAAVRAIGAASGTGLALEIFGSTSKDTTSHEDSNLKKGAVHHQEPLPRLGSRAERARSR